MAKEAAKPAKSSDKPKVFDVAKPGRAAPSASSKPIIITNRPVLQDPMMKEDKAALQASNNTMLPPSKTTIQIRPIHLDSDGTEKPATEEGNAPSVPALAEPATTEPAAVSDEADAASTAPDMPADEKSETATKAEPPADPAEGVKDSIPEPAAPEAPSEDPTEPAAPAAPAPKPVSASAPAAPTPKEPDEAPAASSETSTDEDSDKVEPTDPKADEEAAHKLAEREAEVAKLVESRKYYLPINQVEKRRNKRAAALGLLLIIILAVAWADVALDAGIVKIPGVKPLTHFFNK